MLILKNRTLRWSSPMRFNDPFDTTQELRLAFDPDVLNELLTEEWISLIKKGSAGSVSHPILAMLGHKLDNSSSEERDKFVNDLRGEPLPSTRGQIDAVEALREHWRNVVPGLRVLCLSESNDVTSMWLHYSDNYKGVVLEFEALDEIDSSFLVARQVTYQDAPPAIANARTWVRCLLGQSQNKLMKLMKEYQYTKTNDWAYEREWRIVTHARSDDTAQFADYDFHPRELTRVYFGPQCSDADKSAILAALSNGLEHVSCHDAVAGANDGKFNFRSHHR